MAPPYTQEQFWKLYEKLPQELKDALFDEETGNATYEVCKRYEIESHLTNIVDLVGQVFLGVLLPQDLQNELERLNIPKETSGKVAREINRFVFYPVKPALEQLHRMEIEVTAKIVTPQPPKEEDAEEKPEEPRGDDKYREELE